MSSTRMLFPNIFVSDLPRTLTFWAALGFEFNRQFTNDKAACMMVNEGCNVMMLTEAFFVGFTKKPVTDLSKSCEMTLCLTAENRDGVEDLVNKAIAAGGSKAGDPQDHGFMYGWSFYDPDGHHWEVVWMDPSAIQ
jgi:uncharacterized protein